MDYGAALNHQTSFAPNGGRRHQMLLHSEARTYGAGVGGALRGTALRELGRLVEAGYLLRPFRLPETDFPFRQNILDGRLDHLSDQLQPV